MKNKESALKFMALLTGIIAMTFSGLNWQIGVLAWIAPTALLYYSRRSKLPGFILFFIALSVAGYISQTCNNVYDVIIIGIINGIIYAIFHTLIYLIDKLMYRPKKGFFSTLVFPSIFVTLEYLVSIPIGTSGVVAQSQLGFIPLAHLSAITSLYGISFILFWFASIINWIIENQYNKLAIRKSLIIYGSIFLLIMIFGFIRSASTQTYTQKVKVATISSKMNLHALVKNEEEAFSTLIENPEMEIPERFFSDQERIHLQISNTLKAAEEGAKIIVWNEISLILNKIQIDSLLTQIKSISKAHKTYILLAFLEQNTSNAPKPFNNKSVLITPKGEVGWEYLKTHLAPAEVPIINAGDAVIPFIDTEYGRMANVICYDLDFPNYLKQAERNAIDIMLVPSYDWKGYEKLHSNMARFAVLQSGFSMIRANGAGINLVCDNHANIIATMDTFNATNSILLAELPISKAKTIFLKSGDIFVYLLMIFMLIIIMIRIIPKQTIL